MRKPHTLRSAATATAAALALLLAPHSARAERGNADASEQDTPCEAADLVAAARGLCRAYCEALDCDGAAPAASDTACERVLERWDEHTDGRPLPCEAAECPCWSSAEELESVHAANSAPSNGRPTYRFCFEDDPLLGVSDSIVRTGIVSRVDTDDAS